MWKSSRLNVWNANISPMCKICNQQIKTSKHLFFNCGYSCDVWKQVLSHLQRHPLADSNLELEFAIKKARSTKSIDKVYVMLFTENVYDVWLQRNSKVFRNSLSPPNLIAKEIVFRVSCRCSELERHLLIS
ncbi:uncharacterized protein LOC104883104 [Beta vulgaris subsp. vulgaris]|uniref:uncharacterized protein LOC104883104 n=1 Tax=Beta vulgaris subsp. vulgaris TaxID=3555 RepID=UPI00053F941D|nr:uncharacterized protein LOC104883104 [Beta vulgaris subsp. vulgaris]